MWGINEEIREIKLEQTPRFTWKIQKEKNHGEGILL